jgi:hypothetical protein
MADPWAVTACIPTIPPRAGGLLAEAVASVWAQTRPVAALAVARDNHRQGAWAMRARLLRMVDTPLLAFCDDDDRWGAGHVAALVATMRAERADYVFSWFTGHLSRGDPLGHFGKPFDPAAPHHTTMTILVRTELARAVGFSPPEPGADRSNEDWRFILGCVAAGARIVHHAERTWDWRHHGANTSGLPSNW